MSNKRFSALQAHNYWSERHQKYGDWRSVGCLDGSSAINKALYASRLRSLRQVLSNYYSNSLIGKRVLDVGCGLGTFSNYYNARGANVSGIDISCDAVEYCNAQDIGNFVQGEAREVINRFDQPFDIIHCFDVLYHITDDLEWAATLAAFDKLSNPETLWLITEIHSIQTDIDCPPHLVKRKFLEYKEHLAYHEREIVKEKPLYWLYTAHPRLAYKAPWLIPKLDAVGAYVTPYLREWAALWVIKKNN